MTSDHKGAWAGLRVLVLSPVPTWPVTFGNRNRIVQVNRALQREGAHVALLHYPSDDEWRSRLPRTAMAEMARQWEEVFHLPATRPLHTRPAKGEDHRIDEWWDPAIGQMLDWLFKVGRYDALLVNYTWLSKALEHAPRGVLRILDTHDRFSGRRDLLTANGLAPEYFHTTETEEAVGLNRADIVWAIKAQEEAFFRTITDRPVATLLHMEPPAAPSPPPSRDGVLRFGIVGGRNNVNATNIRRFAEAADRYLARTLLPVEVLVAGSVCDLIGDLRQPWLRLVGRVAEMDELYAQVDAVLAPLAFSTGLKIKVGEALARAKPLISHAHAFEGYVPTHAFHECPDFEAMLRAMHQIARDPGLLGVLADASARSVAAASASIGATLADAGARARAIPPSVIFFLRFDQLCRDSLLLDHVLDAAHYAGFRAPVAFHLSGAPDAAEDEALALLAARGRMLVEPEALDAVAAHPAMAEADSRPQAARIAELLAEPHPMAWFAHAPELPPAAQVRIQVGVAHLGALWLAGGREDAARIATAFPRFLALSAAPSADAARLAAASGAERLAVPLLWRGEDSRLLASLRATPRGPVALLTRRPDAPDLLPLLAFLTRVQGRQLRLFHAGEAPPSWPASGPLAVRTEAIQLLPIDAFFRAATWSAGGPGCIIEHGRPTTSVAREVALRAGIPHLSVADPAAPAVAKAQPSLSGRARGFVSAALLLAALDRDVDWREADRTLAVEYGQDAGWARIWRELGDLVAA
ncbi:glycosyltransferase [Roseomonas sp. PWR1]|uniref:Glycosyltransferase n=1 Tax=Roseomonas nitratireducens TaxID=2820810 RepID=A0ABS4AP77_9PROT|nr:glycosyltransferase family 4 protein [Neoroseomonas nitratireducens]MBP0463163.1 glycosyltransferase [Neoroseomonas nitratireducens]